MIAAVIDNGSLEPAAHRSLRALAAALSARTAMDVHAVSWKYSDQICAESLRDGPAWTLAPWLRAQCDAGHRDFAFIPFFISPEGTIGSRLRRDAERLCGQVDGCRIVFTTGLAVSGALARITALRVREAIAANHLRRPALVVVNHGSPSAASASVRDEIASELRRELARELRAVTVASLGESRHAHNHPSYTDVFSRPGFDHGDVVVAPLFLAPGRHAGPSGDLARTAALAMKGHPGLACHFAELPGTQPHVVDVLAEGLRQIISQYRDQR